MRYLALSLSILILTLTPIASAADEPKAKVLRAGMIGLDTSHCIAFTKILNDPKATAEGAMAVDVVVAFPGGSPDIESSHTRVEGFTKQMREMGVEIVETIPALLEKCDVVLIESVDGRPHLAQARPVIEAKKPLYIDKPLAGSLADAIAIAELAKQHNVPWFSSSSLRFGKTVQAVKNDPKVGEIRGAIAWSPCPLEPTHPDLFWYGIHGVEELFTLMGPGCVSVQRVHTEKTDVVNGVWGDGRVGTFRGIRDGKAGYGGIAFGSKSTADAGGYGGYEPLCEQIGLFFKTGKPPVAPEETLEIIAFMEAADESKRQGGAMVKLGDVMEKARAATAAAQR